MRHLSCVLSVTQSEQQVHVRIVRYNLVANTLVTGSSGGFCPGVKNHTISARAPLEFRSSCRI
eukprot:10345060-Heterocapsa_arctica.AAC.1